jgi:hypothetical protein
MRTLIIILSGFVLWTVCLAVAKLFGSASLISMVHATRVFAVIWFLIAAGNMWIGLTQADYSFKEELPIFLLIFLLPVATAIFVKWKFP